MAGLQREHQSTTNWVSSDHQALSNARANARTVCRLMKYWLRQLDEYFFERFSFFCVFDETQCFEER